MRLTDTSARLARYKYWLLALATLPFLGMVAAFGTAPDTLTRDIPQQTTIEPLPLAASTMAPSDAPLDFWREERIRTGDTLGALLGRMGVDDAEILAVLAAARAHDGQPKLLPGQTVLARVTGKGRLLNLRHLTDTGALLNIERVEGRFRIEQRAIHVEPTLVMRAGVVSHSLYGATDSADIPDSVASEMAEIFSGEIDFHRDLRRGDHFSVVYEAYLHEGRLLKTGRLLAAEFTNDGRRVQALYYPDVHGKAAYYTPEGRSLKRAFLRSPLPFTRVTSGFSSARYHPVLKEWRAHRGIDYGAPVGTPVRAVSDASVKFVGKQRGYGNLVVLDHAAPYSTAYGHLSRFASGLHKGSRVSQGQVIGYVGMTGLATGPHLHYEFRVAGKQQNPLAMNLPTSYPLEARQKPRFLAETAPLQARMEVMRGHRISALD